MTSKSQQPSQLIRRPVHNSQNTRHSHGYSSTVGQGTFPNASEMAMVSTGMRMLFTIRSSRHILRTILVT